MEADKLSVRYGEEKILDGLSFRVERGEFAAVIGPSGCGKSTLLNVLAGLLPAAEGTVRLDGEEIRGLSPRFAYMPQDDLLMPWKTVLDNVCLYGSVHGGKRAMRGEAEARLRAFGLSGCAGAYPRELSGGMRQRAAFLRTSLCPAEVLLLDEPFAALDVITRWEMQDWLRDMRRSLPATTLLVTHDVDEALYLAERILILSGRPARVLRELRVPDSRRDRDWLLGQEGRKREIIEALRGAAG